MVTLLLVVIVVSLLILVHEWGHFFSARKFGVKVEEFGFGFPPKIVSFVKNGVRYSLNLLPFGGFVKIFGEHGEGENDPRSFIARPAWQRFTILAAGVGMNFCLAWVFFSAGSVVGVPQLAEEKTDGVPVSIIAVTPHSPAEKAGLRFGDQVIEMRVPGFTLHVAEEKDVRDFTEAYRGEEVVLFVRHGESTREVRVIPRVDFPGGEGPLGIAIGRLLTVRTPWYQAPLEGARILWRSTVATAEGLFSLVRDLVVDGKTSAAVSGPVGIFFLAEDTRALGFAFFVQFAGLLSVNLAILNFLPIPALDGGRILFLVIEKIKGKRINPRVENLVHGIGFALLLLLMVLITYRDVIKIL